MINWNKVPVMIEANSVVVINRLYNPDTNAHKRQVFKKQKEVK